jgi:hypothetical protein
MSQASVKLARRFVFVSMALAEKLGSTLKVSSSLRRSFEFANERQQGFELFLVQFFNTQRLLSALVLQGCLVGLTIRFSAGVHAVSPAELRGRNVLGTRAFRPLTLREGHLLTLTQFLKANALQRLGMEKKVFGTASADETKTLVRQLLDRAFGHLNISREYMTGRHGTRMPT